MESINSKPNSESLISEDITKSENDLPIPEDDNQAMANMTKPNVPNVNVPERILICIDVCYSDQKTLYKLGDGTTYTPLNMVKKILDFFLHLKSAINKETEFALMLLQSSDVFWLQNFTSNIRELMTKLDYINVEECTAEQFDFSKVFELVKEKVHIPEYKEENYMLPPPFVVRMIVIYGRSICMPLIPSDDTYFNALKKELYFYIDIVLTHEEDCELNKCEEIYDALQDLDNGYSYVFEVSRNATKVHDCMAKLLAHPLQRTLQKNTNYSFGSWRV